MACHSYLTAFPSFSMALEIPVYFTIKGILNLLPYGIQVHTS